MLLTLRFYATGSIVLAVGDFVSVSKSAACVAVKITSQAIARMSQRYIRFPITRERKDEIKQKFYTIARFLFVIGAIDCAYIRLQSPGGNTAENY